MSMADIRHQPGGSEKMNAINKTSYPHGQLALQFMKKLLLSECGMISVFDRKRRLSSLSQVL